MNYNIRSYAAPPRVRRALGKPSEAESSADGRGVATCRVAVLEARGLAAADDNITTEASSDPYVAIVTAPGEPPPEVAEARTPTLVGVTDGVQIKSSTRLQYARVRMF